MLERTVYSIRAMSKVDLEVECVYILRSIRYIMILLHYMFLQGYESTQAFIATQGPLENTVNDFWKMIYEYRSKCIVMLNKEVENGNVHKLEEWLLVSVEGRV